MITKQQNPTLKYQSDKYGQLLEGKHKLCFNPNCTLFNDRVFSSTHDHCTMANCSQWIIDVQQIETLVPQPSKRIQIDLGGKSLKNNFAAFLNLTQTNWQNNLRQTEEIIIKSLTEDIRNVFSSLYLSIQKICAESIIRNLKQLVTENDENRFEQKIGEIIESYLRPLSDKKMWLFFEDEVCLKLPDTVKDHLTKNYYIEQKIQSQSYDLVSTQNSQKFYDFLFGQSTFFNKLQILSSMCGWAQPQFRLIDRTISLKCPLCSFEDVRNINSDIPQKQAIKNKKKYLAQNILLHTYQGHYSIIYKAYSSKTPPNISPSNLKSEQQNQQNLSNNNNNNNNNYSTQTVSSKRISYCEALQQMSSYRKLCIIDRQSGISNKNQFYEEDTYYVQVLTANPSLAKNKYILTENRRITEIIINLLYLEACWYRKTMIALHVKIWSNSQQQQKVKALIDIMKNSQIEGSRSSIQPAIRKRSSYVPRKGKKIGKIRKLGKNKSHDRTNGIY